MFLEDFMRKVQLTHFTRGSRTWLYTRIISRFRKDSLADGTLPGHFAKAPQGSLMGTYGWEPLLLRTDTVPPETYLSILHLQASLMCLYWHTRGLHAPLAWTQDVLLELRRRCCGHGAPSWRHTGRLSIGPRRQEKLWFSCAASSCLPSGCWGARTTLVSKLIVAAGKLVANVRVHLYHLGGAVRPVCCGQTWSSFSVLVSHPLFFVLSPQSCYLITEI